MGPEGSKTLDPFQVSFLMQVPGQSIPLHMDTPYFWGNMNRFTLPQWLLVMMKFSGAFEKHFIDQVQVVSYLHSWEDDRGGQFVLYDDSGKMIEIPPRPGTGVILD